MKYSLKCTCGHVMSVDASTRVEAVEKLKGMMDQAALDKHWVDMHASDSGSKPTLEQSHAQIDANTYEDMGAAPAAPMA